MTSTGPVVVLGGTGFVGRQVCATLAARGCAVAAVGRRPPRAPFPYRFLPLDLGQCTVREAATLLAAERPSAAVNCVGSIWGKADAEMWPTAAAPTLRLLDALGQVPEPPRLVHLGSVLEYGPLPSGATAGPGLSPRPDTAYGKAKWAATQAVLQRSSAGALDAMVLRIANVAGPGTPRISLLGRVAEQLLAARGGTALIELAPLRAHRDYVDVRDVADAVARAVDAPVRAEVVDIGRGEAVPVRSLVDLLIGVSGVPAQVLERESEPAATDGGPRPARDWLRVDIRLARELLGWWPRHTLADAVRAFWNDIANDTAQDAAPGIRTDHTALIHQGGWAQP